MLILDHIFTNEAQVALWIILKSCWRTQTCGVHAILLLLLKKQGRVIILLLKRSISTSAISMQNSWEWGCLLTKEEQYSEVTFEAHSCFYYLLLWKMSTYMLIFHYFVARVKNPFPVLPASNGLFCGYMYAECNSWWRSAPCEDQPRPRWEVWLQR